jgi:hypothetical protein
MTHNIENPQFWQPFNLSKKPFFKSAVSEWGGRRVFKTDSDGTSVGEIMNSRNFPGLIVYTEFKEVGSVHELLGMSGFAVTQHLRRLQVAHVDLQEYVEVDADLQPRCSPSSYGHAFVWRLGKCAMTDIWTSSLDDEGYPSASVRVFCDLEEVDVADFGCAGGSTLIVMGREEEYRRTIQNTGRTILDYIYRDRNNMPSYEPGFIAHARHQRR